MHRRLTTLLAATALAATFRSGAAAQPSDGTFGNDVAFLRQYVEVLLLKAPDLPAQVAVVPGMQARVMTSTADGDSGMSFGWINRALVARAARQPHINVFGGEDRFWLGPEGGQYGLFFRKGDPFDLAHWQTPEPIDWGAWELTARTAGGDAATFRRLFSVTNYAGTVFSIAAERTIRVFGRVEIARQLGLPAETRLKTVGFETDNAILNTGAQPWTAEKGQVSIWILGMFKPAPQTVVVVPYRTGPEAELGAVVNDTYFGKVPANRLRVDPRGFLLFRADGQHRSKIGLSPRRARGVMGSYNAAERVLTVVTYTQPEGALDYVNSEWKRQEQPYRGDAANSYNDGPPGPGQAPLGPFYELESSSPAAALAPGGEARHVHRTFHLQGPEEELDAVARAQLGTGLQDLRFETERRGTAE